MKRRGLLLCVLIVVMVRAGYCPAVAQEDPDSAEGDFPIDGVTLGIGYSGRAIQYMLRARGYKVRIRPLTRAEETPGSASYGANWREVELQVKKFQRAHGLDPTGSVDRATWDVLVKTLKRGDKGDFVRAAQVLLRGQGFKVAIDGNFGVQTEQAVKAYKRRRRVTVSGLIGPITWRRLEYLVDGAGAGADSRLPP